MRAADSDELKKLYAERYVSKNDLRDFMRAHPKLRKMEKELEEREKRAARHLNLIGFLRARWELKYFKQRKKLNAKFIRREQKKRYEVEGNRLDPQQIAAVVACEDAELILAPAGSGKTASLLAKLNYLMEVLEIPPEEILVIAFTNKVVAELKMRTKCEGVEIRTFHSLGNKIVKEKYKDFRVVSEYRMECFFRKEILEMDWETLKKTEGLNAEEFENLCLNVFELQKSGRVSLKEYKKRLWGIEDQRARDRARRFYKLYKPIAQKYIDFLEGRNLYDFADMLNMATEIVEEREKGAFSYKYVLVDEAQDLSVAKYMLLKAILAKCRSAKLFAVGDDWQSIYRFAGSNLGVLRNFEQIFRRETYRGKIELTYRFGEPTAEISNRFIEKNPYQSRKRVKTKVKRETPIVLCLNRKHERHVPEDYWTVNQILLSLYKKYGQEIYNKKIQLISRYNRDIFRVVNEKTRRYHNALALSAQSAYAKVLWKLPGEENAKKKLEIPYCSIHRAKGITRDIIIMLNANRGDHGIPSTREWNLVVDTLLTELDSFPFAEERRLFYVAITRAKEQTFIVADEKGISPFVHEIEADVVKWNK